VAAARLGGCGRGDPVHGGSSNSVGKGRETGLLGAGAVILQL
jgi:hypothetical protein